jgi:hypothetical protein
MLCKSAESRRSQLFVVIKSAPSAAALLDLKLAMQYQAAPEAEVPMIYSRATVPSLAPFTTA